MQNKLFRRIKKFAPSKKSPVAKNRASFKDKTFYWFKTICFAKLGYPIIKGTNF